MSFTVAIVGRPNVGKSTLFNRLVGRRAAIVHDQPGVTRDRREGEGRIGPLHFTLIDTAGLAEAAPESLEGRMQVQTGRAISAADVTLLLVDGRAGITPDDKHFAAAFRREEHSVIVVVNKCEGGGGNQGFYEAYELGLGDPVAISAEHGEGMGDLYDELQAHAPGDMLDAAGRQAGTRPLQLAIVGRPNAGKSTLLNRLVGEERSITGPEPGITRDAVAVEWSFEGRPVRLVDTAGLRRKARVSKGVEKLSTADALGVIRLAEVVILVIDAQAPLEHQDITIAQRIHEEGRALVIAANKWDLVVDRAAAMTLIHERLEDALAQAKGVPVIALSALEGGGVDKLMPAAFGAIEIWNRRIATAQLNRWLERVVAAHSPPAPRGRRLKLRYMTQVKARPPTFALFVSRPSALPEAYRRYLVNRLREAFGFAGVPLRILLRAGKNPYADRKTGKSGKTSKSGKTRTSRTRAGKTRT